MPNLNGTANATGDIAIVAVLYTGAVDVVAHYGSSVRVRRRGGRLQLLDVAHPADRTGQ